mmetsp:Transcript_14123/g.56855  ORF Transcript_14123/g.56855 Transcript_14123/m.56855 type:complete len:91 (+) Transcript_14123:754-1026(+)
MYQAELFFGALVIGTPIVVLYTYSRDMLGLRWREWLTKKTLGDYFDSINYYDIENNSDVVSKAMLSREEDLSNRWNDRSTRLIKYHARAG